MKWLFLALLTLSLCACEPVPYEPAPTQGRVIRITADGRVLDCIAVSTSATGTSAGDFVSLTFIQLVGCKEVPQ